MSVSDVCVRECVCVINVSPPPALAWPWAPPQEGNEPAGWRVEISAFGVGRAEGRWCADVQGRAKVEEEERPTGAIGENQWINLMFDFDKHSGVTVQTEEQV